MEGDQGGEDVGGLSNLVVEAEHAIAVGVHPLLVVQALLNIRVEGGGEADAARGGHGIVVGSRGVADEE